MADQTETWDQVFTQANTQNMKRFVEEWAELSTKASHQATYRIRSIACF